LILTMHGLIGLVDVAELLAAELIGNAVLHTKGPAALRVRWSAGVLRIGTWDADPEPPDAPARLADVVDEESGRGLVDAQLRRLHHRQHLRRQVPWNRSVLPARW
ncbi:ATP-binding protein, partial [Streptomyces sp. NPDC058527]|uniref:ATP-binding protein n=1 Tax=Streptomyces sp. NPDC058527 TaxID=3346539 RepID=UPI0036666EDE